MLQVTYALDVSKRRQTCQPIPRLSTEGGIGVALAYLETAMKAPVDCIERRYLVSMFTITSLYNFTHYNEALK
jgi:hypothetical protein